MELHDPVRPGNDSKQSGHRSVSVCTPGSGRPGDPSTCHGGPRSGGRGPGPLPSEGSAAAGVFLLDAMNKPLRAAVPGGRGTPGRKRPFPASERRALEEGSFVPQGGQLSSRNLCFLPPRPPGCRPFGWASPRALGAASTLFLRKQRG